MAGSPIPQSLERDRPSWTMSRIYFWESLKDVTDTVSTRSSLTWYFASISNQLPYVYASGLSDPTKGGVSQIKAELGHQNFCTITVHGPGIRIPQIISGYCQMLEITLHLWKVVLLFCYFQRLIKISWNPRKMSLWSVVRWYQSLFNLNIVKFNFWRPNPS